jgi:hypothetical protein
MLELRAPWLLPELYEAANASAQMNQQRASELIFHTHQDTLLTLVK